MTDVKATIQAREPAHKNQKKGKSSVSVSPRKNEKPSKSKIHVMRVHFTAKFLQLLNKAIEDQKVLHLVRGGSVETFKVDRNMIPWWSSLFEKGTTVVSLKLNFTSTKISLTAATAYSTVQLINFGLCTNHTPLASVFDEYRLFKGVIKYRAYGIPNLSPAGATDLRVGAVIDYDDSTALTNFGDAFDTVKYGQICSSGYIPKLMEWPVKFDWLPDMTWTTTVTTATPVCYWKPFVASSHGVGSIATGYLEGYLDVQVRQLI